MGGCPQTCRAWSRSGEKNISFPFPLLYGLGSGHGQSMAKLKGSVESENDYFRRIMRPTDVPDTGLLCDLLWSDPDKDVQVRLYWKSNILFIKTVDGEI